MTELYNAVSFQTKPQKFQDIPQYAIDFGNILNDEPSHDFQIISSFETFFSHKVILESRSTEFKRVFKENPAIKKIILNEEYEPKAVLELLRFLYSGKPNLQGDSWKIVLPLAEKFKLSELKKLCFNEMMKKVKIDSVLSLITKARSGTEKYYDDIFISACISLLAKKPSDVFETKDFLNLDKHTLLMILQNDELLIEEIDLMNHVLRWGRSKLSPGEELKGVLTEDIMKLIRYPLMSSEDLYTIVRASGVCPEDEWITALEYLVTGDELPPKYQMRGSKSGLGASGFKNGRIIALKNSHGEYLSVGAKGTHNYSHSKKISDAEKFTLVLQSNGKYGLKTMNGTYICANSNGLYLQQPHCLEWEWFTVNAVSSSTFSLFTWRSTYVSMASNGTLTQSSTVGKNETFSAVLIG
eukprot:gene9208-1294_t